MWAWVRRNRGAVALALLSPFIAEVLTGSTSITSLFVFPPAFLVGFGFDVMLYGAGVILVREAVVRWDKGWASVLLLGAAYGIVEEGLAVHTFFQPGGNPVGALGTFGRFAGVNGVWAVGLTVFHAVYSIALPILLVSLIYPETRGVRFVEGRGLYGVGACYVGVVLLFAIVVPYFPPPATFAAFALLLFALVGAARWVPKDLLRLRPGPRRMPGWTFVAAGLVLLFDWLLLGIDSPTVVRSAPLAIALFLGVLGLVLLFLVRFAGTIDLRRTEFLFALGLLGVFFFWDAVLEFILVPGILVATAGLGVFLYWLHRRIEAADRRQPSRMPLPGPH